MSEVSDSFCTFDAGLRMEWKNLIASWFSLGVWKIKLKKEGLSDIRYSLERVPKTLNLVFPVINAWNYRWKYSMP
jgi:hypothetical protein